jgi:hypothetical protein
MRVDDGGGEYSMASASARIVTPSSLLGKELQDAAARIFSRT